MTSTFDNVNAESILWLVVCRFLRQKGNNFCVCLRRCHEEKDTKAAPRFPCQWQPHKFGLSSALLLTVQYHTSFNSISSHDFPTNFNYHKVVAWFTEALLASPTFKCRLKAKMKWGMDNFLFYYFQFYRSRLFVFVSAFNFRFCCFSSFPISSSRLQQ
jgi:hypothetical protein